MTKPTAPSVGCVVVSNSKTAIGLHLTSWKTKPSALLALHEAQEIVRQLTKAIAEVKAAQAPDDDHSDLA